MKSISWFKNYSSVLLFAMLLLGFGISRGQKIAKFKNGDKICFIGNSITQDGRYHMLVHTYCATRFPDEMISLYNCGISGDVANGMISRMNEDILVHKPDYAFLMTGMNDIQRYLYRKDVLEDSAMLVKRKRILDEYESLTARIAQTLEENQVSPIFMTPSIYDQTAKIPQANNYGANDALKKCAIHVHKLGERFNAPVVDLNSAMETINAKMQAIDPNSTLIGPDRIHPGDAGHFVMAYNIIKTVMPSKYISKLVIDGRKGKIIESVDCEVFMGKDEECLQFDLVQESLPFPIIDRFKSALDLIPFQDEFNNELLVISKLTKGEYQLKIDELVIDTLSNIELKNGINLADYSNTPQYKQAVEVFELCEKYHAVNRNLRAIAFVQYRMLNKYEGANTIEGKRAFLDVNLEEQKGKSWYDYNVKTVNEYFENLPKEKQLSDELKELRKQIFQKNKPCKHTYHLVKVLN